jgi:ribA/ribD-fused uncharacterized protein
MNPEIKSFSGEYRFLSNFYPAVVQVSHGTYLSVEHAYQAGKCYHEKDRQAIRGCPTPGRAKQLGRMVRVRPDWEINRVTRMYEAVNDKFTRHPELAAKLLATGDAHLEEGNHWGDRFWGTVNGEGKNWLGRILMKVRGELRKAQE